MQLIFILIYDKYLIRLFKFIYNSIILKQINLIINDYLFSNKQIYPFSNHIFKTKIMKGKKPSTKYCVGPKNWSNA